jgi:hypothetical protein
MFETDEMIDTTEMFETNQRVFEPMRFLEVSSERYDHPPTRDTRLTFSTSSPFSTSETFRTIPRPELSHRSRAWPDTRDLLNLRMSGHTLDLPSVHLVVTQIRNPWSGTRMNTQTAYLSQ